MAKIAPMEPEPIRTVGDLVQALLLWPQDSKISVAAPVSGGLADIRSIAGVEYWAAYNEGFVVID